MTHDLETSTRMPDHDAPDDAAQDDNGSGSSGSGSSGRRSRRPLLPLLIAVLLVVLSGATAITLGVQLSQERQLNAAREDALAAARVFATDLTTYDHADLDQDFAAVLDGSTDPFKSQYADTTEDLRELFQQFQATSTSTLLGSGVAEVTEDTATVVLFVDQTVRNTNSAEPRIDRNRVRVELEKVDGKWLAAEVAVT